MYKNKGYNEIHHTAETVGFSRWDIRAHGAEDVTRDELPGRSVFDFRVSHATHPLFAPVLNEFSKSKCKDRGQKGLLL